jgi:hypothetical protein
MVANTFILSGNSSDFTTYYPAAILLNPKKKYEAALLSIDLYNSFPNITEENNKFKYSADGGITWKVITLNTGSYELSAINDEIQRLMIINDDYDKETNTFYINISANISTLKSVIGITNEKYKIDFSVTNSIGSTLGFEPIIIQHGYNESQEIVNIMKINSILVNVDFISGSYVKGSQYPVIYSFFPNVSPGRKIIERPNPSLVFYSVNKSNIISMRLWLTDQDNNLVDVRGETVTVRILIREKANIEYSIKRAIKKLKGENVL